MISTIYAKPEDEFLSDVIDTLPSNCLFNKGITGCGGTTLEINSKRNSIILVPTINLVLNKTASNPHLIGVCGTVSQDQFIKAFKNKSIKKIIATYDSLPKLINWIGSDIYNYFLLIDEYHILFNNYTLRYKAINNILSSYQNFREFCFMTATPLKEDNVLEELKHLDQIEVIWPKAIPVNVTLYNEVRTSKRVLDLIKDSENRDWNYHIFINSINTIRSIVKSIPENIQYRTICSQNAKGNDLKSGGKLHVESINSSVCKINFYTATAFEGVDIYDPIGKTIVVSDTNIAQSLVDISTLFVQICGRLRDSVYKEEVIFICNTGNHRYLKHTTESAFINYSNELKRLAINAEEQFNNMNSDGQLTYYSIYEDNPENHHNKYISGKQKKLVYDPNLKKLDLQNYDVIMNVFKCTTSVLKRMSENNIQAKDSIDSIYYEIYQALPKIQLTSKEIQRELYLVFEKYNLASNKEQGDLLDECAYKKRVLQNGKRVTLYDFTKLKLLIHDI